MAMEVVSSFSLSASIVADQDTDLFEVRGKKTFAYNKTLTNGTGANEANQIWEHTYELEGDQVVNFDLAGGITDMFGNTVTFTKIKAIMIKNTSNELATPTTANIYVGGAVANQFINWVGDASDKIRIVAGGVFILTAPDATAYGVTPGTGDQLRIANNEPDNHAQYEIVFVGVV